MSVVAPFPSAWDRRQIATFDRKELTRILDLYGRMVAAGHWRDYALRIDPEVSVFAAYRRHSEHPEVRIEKRPSFYRGAKVWIRIPEAWHVREPEAPRSI